MSKVKLNIRLGNTVEELRQDILDHIFFTLGRTEKIATLHDWYLAVAYTVRDKMMEKWVRSLDKLYDKKIKIIGYLSAEFLVGPHLGNAMINLNIQNEVKAATAQLGQDLNQLMEQEEEPGLGNGGLGRLAACFIDSLSTLHVPAIGYGVRYEFGIFDQRIKDGWQVEETDKWLKSGNPWEIVHPEISYHVKFGGHTNCYKDKEDMYRVEWTAEYEVKGVAYDTPIPGYKNTTINILRLWKSEAVESFDFNAFNKGDYYNAVSEKVVSENISKILYPNDEPAGGKRLRLSQQYFFVSCSLQDALRLCRLRGFSINKFHESFNMQLNDTHPAIAVAELMRLLVDEHSLDWDEAWEITKKTFSYTNHTLLPEALEKWSLQLLSSLLPRHLEIIYEINGRFLADVRNKFPGNDQRISNLSIIDETGERYIRMAHLACIGSHAINGVSILHTSLLKQSVLRDFYILEPEKFYNITNGVTPRRWLKLYNPELSNLITKHIGDRWISHLETELIQLEKFADDKDFQQKWRRIKLQNKKDLARLIGYRTGVEVKAGSVFDIQVKRIHEYKRQLLNLLHIIHLYNRLKKNPAEKITSRTFIFGGKAAPGYFMAKLIIKLINAVADKINYDPDVGDQIRVVFFPDFNVKNSEYIYRAADISEQISTAGMEASGTGNMKFSLNGALTIGTLDGANVEILEAVGKENFFLFGLIAEEVFSIKQQGYKPYDIYTSNPDLKEVIDMIGSGIFSNGDRNLFKPIMDALLHYDTYMVMQDYQAYIDCQKKVSEAYKDQNHWQKMSILNVARMGNFSSDRSISEYCTKIWGVSPKR
ncbi:glycogen/starch/alpha-glucan phosphorylase [Chitinophagaceae bacterium LB-8]|uniref:Alpha-1,4 glucan phosphorylase n=1 Tax=Paraflavisolibacter caeni TaxID=2982496 RepID=A0A9X3BFF6_9BACT|nr:glycogen/starch/alpha-glucan phosphorylase [Paraflavisolibacter caeni]MCU7548724.1 glycogen/starch/alpha-glucan phosphorylase [Paraflavisolibacter caeni]